MTPALLEAVDEFLRVSAPGHAAHERKRAKLNLEAAATEAHRYGAWRPVSIESPPSAKRLILTVDAPGGLVTCETLGFGSIFDPNVTAWMPWPEPYRPALNPGAAWPFPKRDKT